MMELLAVLAFISIVAAAALPTMTRTMRDARVGKAAQDIFDVMRLGVMRAKGRGSAVVVRWNSAVATPSTADAHVEVREGLLGGGGLNATLPAASCLTPVWTTGDPTNRLVASFDERRSEAYELVGLSMLDPNNAPLGFVEFCFTPRGRAYVRTAAGGTFAPMAGVYRMLVTNSRTSKAWMVVIPPNGAIKVVSEI
jgi:hypothetical protein